MAQRVAPFPWYGGKAMLSDTLRELLPPHESYIEVFGGAASLLFAKPPSKLEVYNDIDSGLVAFFRVLRDPDQTRDLQRLLDLTPYSREEYLDCLKSWADAPNDIERARRWFVAIQQGFAGRMAERPGWRYGAMAGHNPAQSFRSAINLLPLFTARLARVEIEHKSFADLIRLYDNPRALFYCDPPYLPETRRRGGYTHEMTRAEHEQLLDLLSAAQGMVILSGYDSDLYRVRLQGWQRINKLTTCSAAGRTKAAGLQGKGSAWAKQQRTECIWIKPNTTQRQLALVWDRGEAGM